MEEQQLTHESAVAAVFLSYFNRAPEFQALQWYTDLYTRLLAEHADLPTAGPAAFKELSAQIYRDGVGAGEVPHGAAVSDTWYVNHLYQNVLGREADQGGLEYWVSQLAAGHIERAELVSYILDAARGDPRDAAYVANRTQVALEFAQWQNSNPVVLPWLSYDAAQVLVGVDESAGTIDAAMGRMHEATSAIGEVYKLTTGVDAIQGGVRNDAFNAYPLDADGNPASTLTAFDDLDGGGGVDTLNIYTDGAAGLNSALPVGASIRNVEIVNFFNLSRGVEAIDAARFEGVEQLWQVGHAADVVNLGADTVAGFRNLGLDYLTITTRADAATATVVLDNVTSFLDRLTIQSADSGVLETVRISGATRDLDGAPGAPIMLVVGVGQGVETFVLDAGLDVGLELAVGHDLTEIDASASGGAVFYSFRDDAVTTLTTGAGDDFVFFDRALRLDDELDGGEGFDTVILETPSFQTQDYDIIRQWRNIEHLKFQNDDVVVDASELADFKFLSVISWNSDAKPTVFNLAADQHLEIDLWTSHDEEGGRVTLENSASDVTVKVTHGFSYIEPGGVYLVVQGQDEARGGTLTLLNDASQDSHAWVSYDNSSGKFSTIDATALDGGLDLSRWNDDDVVPAAGMASGVVETVWLGDGIDWITVGVSFGDDGSSSTIGNMDTIVGFDSHVGDGTHDLLLGFTHVSEVALSAGVTTLRQAFAEAARQFVAGEGDDVNALFFHFEGDTYLYADTYGGEGAGRYDNADFAIKLIGEHDFNQTELIANPY